ncbi:MAG TPA: hypothetical protein VF678_07490, partial [bacterium]
PVAFQLSSFAAHFYPTNDLSGHATFAKPALVVPLSFGPGVELRSTLSRTFVDYSGLYADQPSVVVPLGSEGYGQSQALVELRADLSRVYPQTQPNSTFTAIKHTITPRLIFDAVQDTEQPLADNVVRSQVAKELVTLRLDNKWLGQWRTVPGPPPPPPPLFTTDPPSTTNPAAQTPGGRPPVINPPVGEAGTLNFIQRYNVLLEDKNYQPVGPVIASRQETNPGEPLLPLIVEGSAVLGPVQLNSEVHYHYQLRRITETAITVRGPVRTNSALSITYAQNEFAYRTPENVLHPEGTTFTFNSEVPVADQFSAGFNGVLNLAADQAPLGRRLQSGLLFVDFHPICYRVRLSYQESLELTQQNGVDKYFVNRQVALTFDLGSLFSGTQQRTVTTGVGP